MSRKQTITFPDSVHASLTKAAKESGLSLNRYVIQRLNSKNNIVFINLQELTEALIRLHQILFSDTYRYDEYMRLEVDRLCRFCASFLVRTIKNQG